MLLDIVILPPVKLRRKIGRKIKKEVGAYPHIFVVDNVKLMPHLSLWHIRTSKNKINELTKELKEIVKNQKPIKISSAGFTILKKPKGCSQFEISNSKALSSLQQKVFKKTYPFKTGMMPQIEIWGLWTGEQLKQARKYSRPLWFGPHFTAGILKNTGDALKVVKAMKKVKFNFVAKEIYICEINKWWQVIRIIKRINFG